MLKWNAKANFSDTLILYEKPSSLIIGWCSLQFELQMIFAFCQCLRENCKLSISCFATHAGIANNFF